MRRTKLDELNWHKINKSINKPEEKVKVFNKLELFIIGTLILSIFGKTLYFMTKIKGSN